MTPQLVQCVRNTDIGVCRRMLWHAARGCLPSGSPSSFGWGGVRTEGSALGRLLLEARRWADAGSGHGFEDSAEYASPPRDMRGALQRRRPQWRSARRRRSSKRLSPTMAAGIRAAYIDGGAVWVLRGSGTCSHFAVFLARSHHNCAVVGCGLASRSSSLQGRGA